MPTSCDVIVIGSGQAGPSVAARFAAAGQTAVLIEREHVGGTCVNNGCIPTKTMVASARVAHLARRAAEYGVVLPGSVSVDLRAVQARKDAVVAQSIESLTRWLTGTERLRLVRGHARFVAPHAVQVGDEVYRAPKIFVNVGGRPVLPDWPGLDQVPVLTSESMMALTELPEHLVIVGGSYIGLEFAQMFRRFGSRVTVLEVGPRLIGREDPEVSAEIQAILEREGIEVRLGISQPQVEPLPSAGGSGVRVHLRHEGREAVIDGSHLLVAIGRRPNTDDLGLDRAGIETDARGYIVVDDALQTTTAGVWALGDVNGRGAFTHTAWNDHEIVVGNLLDGEQRRVSDRIPAYALFTDPPLGRIGMTEAEVRASGRRALVGTLPMARVGRARERGETQGFMKVLVDAETERILGAALLCIEGDEIVHSLLDVMAAGASYRVIQRCVHIHPTVSELIPTLLGQLQPLQ